MNFNVLNFRFTYPRKSPYGVKSEFADYLSKKHGFEPNHWYANWKELDKNVWLIFSSTGRSTPESDMKVEVALRDMAPNIGAVEFDPKDVEEFKAAVEKQVKPYVLEILKDSKMKYELI